MPYNGLKNDMNSFAKFVFIYETTIKHFSKAQDFVLYNNDAADFFKKYIQPKVRYVKGKEFVVFQDKPSKQTLFFTKQTVQILDFCRHFRNSFTHATLGKNSMRLTINDSNRNKTTCLGDIDYSSVKDFIVIIVNGYESKD